MLLNIAFKQENKEIQNSGDDETTLNNIYFKNQKKKMNIFKIQNKKIVITLFFCLRK